ncbi:MAG TPA: hypothetical protein VNW50_16025 [Streptosporangiaceae bacterium]|jgi:hypothetical protein|nr:hypothetical protein [Streptosporangiaceae bacterium]
MDTATLRLLQAQNGACPLCGIASVLRDNPHGLASSERWIGPLPKD